MHIIPLAVSLALIMNINRPMMTMECLMANATVQNLAESSEKGKEYVENNQEIDMMKFPVQGSYEYIAESIDNAHTSLSSLWPDEETDLGILYREEGDFDDDGETECFKIRMGKEDINWPELSDVRDVRWYFELYDEDFNIEFPQGLLDSVNSKTEFTFARCGNCFIAIKKGYCTGGYEGNYYYPHINESDGSYYETMYILDLGKKESFVYGRECSVVASEFYSSGFLLADDTQMEYLYEPGITLEDNSGTETGYFKTQQEVHDAVLQKIQEYGIFDDIILNQMLDWESKQDVLNIKNPKWVEKYELTLDDGEAEGEREGYYITKGKFQVQSIGIDK